MLDRAMQVLYLLALDSIVETSGDPNSFGFQNHRSPTDAIEKSFNALSRKLSTLWMALKHNCLPDSQFPTSRATDNGSPGKIRR